MKAVIHIGTHKTGTTTLQTFLGENRCALKKQGIFVPGKAKSWALHLDLIAATCNPSRTALGNHDRALIFDTCPTLEVQDRYWEKYRFEIEKNCSKDDVVLFSSEGLSLYDENEIARFEKLMVSLFNDITIVLYLRRQPEYFVSLYNTLISGGSTLTFSDYLNQPERSYFLDYRKTVVERWSIFGKDKLKIRIFDKDEFCDNDLLSDFANTVGFDLDGLERVKNENTSIGSAETEFLRLLNFHVPATLDPWTFNPDRLPIHYLQEISGKNTKAYSLNRSETQRILDLCREGNDWIAREYLRREKLFSEDVSMYPEEVSSSHNLTVEKCAEITALLWKERCDKMRQRDKMRQQKPLYRFKALLTWIKKCFRKSGCFPGRLTKNTRHLGSICSNRFKALLTWVKKCFKID